MLKKFSDYVEQARYRWKAGDDQKMFRYSSHPGERVGVFYIRSAIWGTKLKIIVNDGCADSHGWEHVSVSAMDRIGFQRCPTWDEMCWIKDLFFAADECVIQFHPPKSEYINCHPHTLHLWHHPDKLFELPPKELV